MDDKSKDLLELLNKGMEDMLSSENFLKYLKVASKFSSYSFNNQVLIYLQKPDATRVAGFKAWNKFGRFVKKGEKGIRIFAPLPITIKEKTKVVDGIETVVEPEYSFISFRPTYVWDVSQTDGEPLPEICNMLDGRVEDFETLVTAIKGLTSASISFTDYDGTSNGFYNVEGHYIVVKDNLSELQKIKTLVHEVTHSVLHCKDKPPKDRSSKEIEAESVAFIVCNYLGLDTSDYSFGYIAGWGGSIEDWKTQCEDTKRKESLKTIRDTAADFISKLESTITKMKQEVV